MKQRDLTALVIRMAQENRDWAIVGCKVHWPTWGMSALGARLPLFCAGTASSQHPNGIQKCAVNRHHNNTEPECIDELGETKPEDRALPKRNSNADFVTGGHASKFAHRAWPRPRCNYSHRAWLRTAELARRCRCAGHKPESSRRPNRRTSSRPPCAPAAARRRASSASALI